MMRALTTAGAGMVAQQYNLDTIANNLANVNTTAFKQMRAEFQDLMYQTFKAAGGTNQAGDAQQVGLGSRFAATAASFTMGPLQSTGNPLDMAINGDGFFQVLRPDGSTAYTRDGSFKISADGTLVNSDGYILQPQTQIDTRATSVNVGRDGRISFMLPGQSEPTILPAIDIARFPNPAGLQRVGQNLYIASGSSGEAQVGPPEEDGAGAIQGGFLEGSNVQVVEEMVKMIMAQRAYEINSKAIQTADDMLALLNNLKR
ncbi:MAG: flagellar basal-body rod protein FlgG [Fimbriimonadaceae bacterium]